MRSRLIPILAAASLAFGISSSAQAADKVKAVASFSILADMVKNVGGDRVEVAELVGPDGDAHEFSPTPADAKKLAGADVFFVNGLGFEGWMERLETSSGFKGATVVASTGVKPRKMDEKHEDHDEHAEDEHDHDGDHEEHAKHEDQDDDHEEHAEGDHHHHGGMDPHAWQDLANGEIYVANIRDGLIAADPGGKAVYEANADKYLAALKAENTAVKTALDALPQSRRRIITSHDAFGYFGDAYGLEILAPEGVSTASEPSAKDVAKIIRQIREDKIPAVFLENITNTKMLEQIAKESGAKIGGTLYSDALSGPDGSAPTYLDMFKHNVGTLTAALSS
ncbi:metal ABC transporter substrate-binding protein [Methyloceanibacter stevinii]|uniref:Metal ABC transporter substrate-binding protein n=1 Tax=Methyloceanibacter stevinii TaxID=1774970 RepID=A0A1E3VJ02_9HYPH|nr:metal ABC transporter substrate-binding protein [Methyloceanibacter stevinii]ODR93495.1 metal ABC transporter substrate-binding protein [Methyloceanibacter stevinii]